jgi:DNA-binding transcriptional MerR regulator/mannose-6-phosphate isomerase-like protein (cupin superfamily)
MDRKISVDRRPLAGLENRSSDPSAANAVQLVTEHSEGIYIAQVSELLGVSPAMLRRWEAQGFIQPVRLPSGFRVYSTADIEMSRRVRDLLKSGLNLEGIRQALAHKGVARAAGKSSTPPSARSRNTVGTRLKRLRRSRGKSLRTLAHEADLSASHLSSIERSLTHPSVAVLQQIAAALGANMVDILGGETRREQLVVRPNERRPLDGYLPGVRIQQLFRVETVLESLLFTVAPGAGSGESYCHEGEEFLFVLQGKFKIVLDGTQSHVLKVGDSMTFASHRPHSFHNPGSTPAKVLWINTPPTF